MVNKNGLATVLQSFNLVGQMAVSISEKADRSLQR